MTSTDCDVDFRFQQDVNLSASLYESACDCVCAALYIAEDLARGGELVQILFEGTHSLREAYHNAVAHEDTDKFVIFALYSGTGVN